MSTDFMDRAPLLRDPHHLQAVRPDQWPMFPTAIASVFVLLLLASFILFACHRFADTTASPASTWQRNHHVPPPLPPPPALRPEAVAALPLVRAGACQEFSCCAVCLTEYEERERVKLMPVCGHVFHPACIDAWLLSHGSCPVCRCSDLTGSRTAELRLDIFDRGGEGEEEEHFNDSHRKIGRSRSCSRSVVEVGRNGVAMVFLQRSCSF